VPVTDEAVALELAMRSILRLFAEGALVYRRREERVEFDVTGRAARARRVRGGGR
jgi:hypothetical protein